eukprot:SAG22_NODE_901_length_6600_cov_1.945854_1_plen_154_part_00
MAVVRARVAGRQGELTNPDAGGVVVGQCAFRSPAGVAANDVAGGRRLRRSTIEGSGCGTLANYTYSCKYYRDVASGKSIEFSDIGGPMSNTGGTTYWDDKIPGIHANSTAPLAWRNSGDIEFVFTHSGTRGRRRKCRYSLDLCVLLSVLMARC